MDFGYKVIRNRLGSLVANAIQKKIKENSSTMIVPITLSDDYETYTTNINASDVVNALKSNILVIYKITNNNLQIVNGIRVHNSNTVIINNFIVNGFLTHTDTTIEVNVDEG